MIICFYFHAPPTTEFYTLSLHDALPISRVDVVGFGVRPGLPVVSVVGGDLSPGEAGQDRSEEHTSELQSRFDLVCRLLLEKKKTNNGYTIFTHICINETTRIKLQHYQNN